MIEIDCESSRAIDLVMFRFDFLYSFICVLVLINKESMEKFYVLLMIAVIVYALFANKINMAVRGDEKVKKVIVVFSVGVLLVCVIAIGASILS